MEELSKCYFILSIVIALKTILMIIALLIARRKEKYIKEKRDFLKRRIK